MQGFVHLPVASQDEQLETLRQENQAMQQMIADVETRLTALEAQE
jgi:hypothetical protein